MKVFAVGTVFMLTPCQNKLPINVTQKKGPQERISQSSYLVNCWQTSYFKSSWANSPIATPRELLQKLFGRHWMHPIISEWYNTVLDPIISRLVLLKDCFLAMACGVVWGREASYHLSRLSCGPYGDCSQVPNHKWFMACCLVSDSWQQSFKKSKSKKHVNICWMYPPPSNSGICFNASHHIMSCSLWNAQATWEYWISQI